MTNPTEPTIELLTEELYLLRYKITLPSGVVLLVDDETNTSNLTRATPQVDVWVNFPEGAGTVEVGDTPADGFATWTCDTAPRKELCACLGVDGRTPCDREAVPPGILCRDCQHNGCGRLAPMP